MTGATSLQTNILAWLTPVAIILVMALGAMAMANRLLKSLAARIVFAAKDHADAREISDELGTTTVRVKSISRPAPGMFESRKHKSRSVSTSEQRRALLLPQEVQSLGVDDAIIFYEGLRPIRCKKIRYFADPRFRKRLLAPPRHAPRRAKATPTAPPSSVILGDRSTLGSTTGAASTVERVAVPPDQVIAGVPRSREVTPQDIERVEELTLEDFAVDFGKVVLPEKPDGERMTTAEMDTA